MAHDPADAPALNHRQERFVRALLTCRTIADAAAEAGVRPESGYRWWSRPDVRAAYKAALAARDAARGVA